MADKKDKRDEHEGIFGDVADDEWLDAIDSWGEDLALPDETPEADALKPHTGEHGVVQAQAEPDPLVDLLEGEMDVTPESGRALGALLGGPIDAGPEPPAPASEMPASDAAPPTAAPDAHLVDEADIVSDAADAPPSPLAAMLADDAVAEPDEPPPLVEASPVTPLEPLGPFERLEPLEPPAPEPPAPEPPALEPPAPEATTAADDPQPLDTTAGVPSRPEGDDFALEIEAAMDSVLLEEANEPPAAAPTFDPGAQSPLGRVRLKRQARPSRPLEVIERYRGPTGPIEPPSLDVFDEILPTEEEGPDPEPSDVGEVLPPMAEPAPIEPSGPGLLAGLDEETQVEPPLVAPPLDDTLLTVDLSALQATDEGAPAPPTAADAALWSAPLRQLVDAADSSQRAADLQWAVAHLAEAEGETEDALDLYREVLHHRPGYLAASLALWRLHVQRREPEEVAPIAENIAEQLGERSRRELLAACADLHWAAGDDDGARRLVESAQATPTTAPLRAQLVALDLATLAGDEEDERRQLQQTAERTDDAPLNAALSLLRGWSLEQAGEARAALSAYQAAAEEGGPEQLQALEGVMRCARRAKDRSAQVAALEASAPLLGASRALRWRQLAALLTHGESEERERALGLLNAAREADDANALIVEARARALRRAVLDAKDDGPPHEAVSAAAQAYQRLAELWSTSAARARAHVEAGRIAERAGERSWALASYQAAAELEPGDIQATEAIARLQRGESDPQVRLSTARAAALAIGSGPARAARHLAAAEILAHEIDDAEEAAAELVEAVEHDPDCLAALAQLERIYRRQQAFEKQAALLDSVATVADDPQTQARLRYRAALVYERDMGDAERALGRYQEVLAASAQGTTGDHERLRALWGVQRCLAALHRDPELIDALEQEAERSVPSVAARLRRDRAERAAGDRSW